MSKIIIKKDGKKIGNVSYNGALMVDQLNAVVYGDAPNKHSECEKIFGKGAYAVRVKG